MPEERPVDTLEHYAKAYCAGDIEAMMALFEDSPEITVIGTGADELCHGVSEVRTLFLRNFGEAEASKFDWDWCQVHEHGDSAVIAVTLTIHLDVTDERIQVPLRWSVVLRRTQGKWLWLHRHASSAASSQSEGKAYPKSSSQ